MLRSPEIQLEAKRYFRLQSSTCAAILEFPDMFHNISYANPRSPVASRTRDEYLPLVSCVE